MNPRNKPPVRTPAVTLPTPAQRRALAGAGSGSVGGGRSLPDILPPDPFYGGSGRAYTPSGRAERVRPSRPLEGAPEGSRGATAVIPALSLGESAAPVVVESPKNGGENAEAITVTLGIEFQGEATGFNPGVPCEVICTLEWGVGGASFSADFDWVQGGSFTVFASYVRVRATYNAPPLGFVGLLPPDVLLSAALSYGDRGFGNTRNGIKRLGVALPLQLLSGATEVINVPRFATSFTVLGNNDTGGANPIDLTFTFISGVGAGNGIFGAWRYNSMQNLVDVPVPNGAWQLSILNNALLATSSSRYGTLFWNLEF